ncbi:MAG TPA: (d)CMP kinase [Thermoanaerobaculia bacterium]|nr:(d)CMP kinase [Thermoanaerobaculia bacterium]
MVAIDGPSGAGKSTVARALARRLEVPYIDTGAMYRAIGLAASRAGIGLPIGDPDAVARIAEAVRVELTAAPNAASQAGAPQGSSRVLLDGEDVSEAIRLPEMSRYASAVSAIPAVRRILVAQQQRLGRESGGVLEGRDIGTKVFPDTPFKFFVTADPAVRALRRTRELAERGTPQAYEAVLAEMEQRDAADGSRADSPLTLDGRYVLVDTSAKSVEAVVEEIEKAVTEALHRASHKGI